MHPQEHINKANVVYMLFGSHLYGLNTPESDMDYKGIYLPELKPMLLGRAAKTLSYSTGNDKSKNTKDDVDCEIFSLAYFVENACKGETFALDMLHCDSPLVSSEIWTDLRWNREKFYSKDMKAYVGYVKKQAAKYGLKGSRLADIRRVMEFFEGFPEDDRSSIRLMDINADMFPTGEYIAWKEHSGPGPCRAIQTFYEVNSKMYQNTNTIEYVLEQITKMWDSYGERAKQAELNEGIDWKAISHALRAGYQARDIYKHGDFFYPLEETEFLKAVKKGEVDYKKSVAPVLEELVEEVNQLAENSKLPAKVDVTWWDNWLYDIYCEEFKLKE